MRLAVVFTALFAVLVPAAAHAAPKVVASFYPVHSLAAGVMAGVGTPLLLVRGASEPHDYALKPSDAKALQSADVIFWIGPHLETFLTRPLRSVKRDASVVQLAKVPGIVLLKNREGGVWEPDEEHGHKGQGDDEDELNMHIWLDPRNAQAMVVAIVETLAAKDPANAAKYQENGTAMIARLKALDDTLAAELKPVAGVPFVVFHDAYQYFDTRYELNAVGSITVLPEQKPSAKRLREIRDKITTLSARCVFGEPQVKPGIVAAVVEGLNVKVSTLDPLESGANPGPNAYFDGMKRLADATVGCLAGK
jgi:zinc transport system substrate-binding protein